MKDVKVGDLVMCPQIDGISCVERKFSNQAQHAGIVTGVYGHKVEILEGPDGSETWDMRDIKLLQKAICKEANYGCGCETFE